MLKKFWSEVKMVASIKEGRWSILIGYLLYYGSIILGSYLIFVTFGYNPIAKICKLITEEEPQKGLQIFLQICKCIFGCGYTAMAAYILRSIGFLLKERIWILKIRRDKRK